MATLPQVKNPQEPVASWIRCQLESGAVEMERPEEMTNKKRTKTHKQEPHEENRTKDKSTGRK